MSIIGKLVQVDTPHGRGLLVGRQKRKIAPGVTETRVLVRFGSVPATGSRLDGAPVIYAYPPEVIKPVEAQPWN